jgi:hypothetical protein
MRRRTCLEFGLFVALFVFQPVFLFHGDAAEKVQPDNIDLAGSYIDINSPEGNVKISTDNDDDDGNRKASSVGRRAGNVGVGVSDGKGSHIKIDRSGIEIVTPNGAVIVKADQLIGNVNRDDMVRVNQSEPLEYVYQDNRDVVIRDRYIDTGSDGLSLGGNSDVVIENCYVRADNVAIKAWGNADVKIVGCTIIGTQAAIISKGNSTVSIKDSLVRGQLSPSGNGDIEDEGNNLYE